MVKFTAAVAAVCLALAAASAVRASTVADWRFEEGTAGSDVTPGTPDNDPSQSPVKDSSGNGNNLKAYAGFTNPRYSTDVPYATVPQTSQANNLGLNFGHDNQNDDLYSQSDFTGAPGINHGLNDHNFAAGFTFEASVKFSDLNAYQTILGQDVNNINFQGDPISNLYFQKQADNTLKIQIIDAGHNVDSVVSPFTVTTGVWYNLVATDDGSTLKFYNVDSLGVATLLGSTATTGGLIFENTNWSVGRGWFNGPADWVKGNIDEVRISDTALDPSQFLAVTAASSVPEPASLSLLAVTSAALLLRRKRA